MGSSTSCFRKTKNYHFDDIGNGSLRKPKDVKHGMNSSSNNNKHQPPFCITTSASYPGHSAGINRAFELPLYDKSPFQIKRQISSSTSESIIHSPQTPQSPLTDEEVSTFFSDSLRDLPEVIPKAFVQNGRPSYNQSVSCHL